MASPPQSHFTERVIKLLKDKIILEKINERKTHLFGIVLQKSETCLLAHLAKRSGKQVRHQSLT
jgi:hypothetical protein